MPNPNFEAATVFPLGSTGDPPVPTGDPPVGTGSASELFRTVGSKAKLLSVPLGRWPNGTGKLPVPPNLSSQLYMTFPFAPAR